MAASRHALAHVLGLPEKSYIPTFFRANLSHSATYAHVGLIQPADSRFRLGVGQGPLRSWVGHVTRFYAGAGEFVYLARSKITKCLRKMRNN